MPVTHAKHVRVLTLLLLLHRKSCMFECVSFYYPPVLLSVLTDVFPCYSSLCFHGYVLLLLLCLCVCDIVIVGRPVEALRGPGALVPGIVRVQEQLLSRLSVLSGLESGCVAYTDPGTQPHQYTQRIL